jgi:hypothetical protein
VFIVFLFGGGAEGSLLNNCIVWGNSSQVGGGIDSSTANNCLIIANSAMFGGNANSSTMNNCDLVDNFAGVSAGGSDNCTLNDCIEVFDTNDDVGSSYNYCCLDFNPGGGPGNITNDPGFVNFAAGDFHLQSNSPCINSGDNTYVSLTNDLDGNPRIVGVTVDMGAYEFQAPTSVLSYAWAQQYGLPTDGSVDYRDLDDTGMNNWQKWIAGLNPTNPASVLLMLPPAASTNGPGVTVNWDSVSNRNYFLQRSCHLSAQPAFSTIQTFITGQPCMTSFTDATATNCGPYYYRIGVQ